MKTWPTMPMAQVTRLVTDGKHGDCEDEENSGYYFLSSKDLRDGRLHYDKPRQITYSDFLATHRRTNLEPGDILLANCGASIGRVGLAQADPRICKTTFQKSVSVIKANTNIVDNRFLYYFVCHKSALLIRLGNGAAQPNLLIGDLKRIEVPVPPLPLQQCIADILSAYDELIENNQRRIRILESIARALYREWFVHFRFPGHENVPRIASPLGEIPMGWEVKKLGSLAEEMRRNIRKGGLEEEQPYVGLEHIPRRSLALDAWEKTNELGSNKLAFKKGEILFGKIRPYFHKVSIAPFDGLCSADTIVIRARQPEYYAIVVSCVSSDEFVAHATATSNGSKMPRANWHVLEEYPVVIPTLEIARQFSAVIEPSIRQMQALVFQTINLRRTRDLLLPRLLSGQINVDPSA
jgi:type I restriction enzyme S subunit